MSAVITLKRGASFSYFGQLKENGLPKDLTNYTLSSEVRNQSGNLMDTFIITITNVLTGEYTAVPTNGTASYPLGTCYFDIKLIYSGDGTITYTETGQVIVQPSITA